jgi:hypothetical protein
MQMCIKIQMANENEEERPNNDEWNFFLKGGEVMDRSQQPPKPQGNNADWITMQMWYNLTELEKVSETFKGIPHLLPCKLKTGLDGSTKRSLKSHHFLVNGKLNVTILYVL